MDGVSSPLRLLRKKPLSHCNTLSRNYLQDSQRFQQVNVRQFPQNFVVTMGSSTKVRISCRLFSVNTAPDSEVSSTVIGIYGYNKVAPFKTILAIQALVLHRKPACPSST